MTEEELVRYAAKTRVANATRVLHAEHAAGNVSAEAVIEFLESFLVAAEMEVVGDAT